MHEKTYRQISNSDGVYEELSRLKDGELLMTRDNDFSCLKDEKIRYL